MRRLGPANRSTTEQREHAMPRHSSGQPGAMVTDRDRQRTWGVGRVFAILTACALLIGLGYLVSTT
jgi:hypothetical protein